MHRWNQWGLAAGLLVCGWIGAGAAGAQVLPAIATHPSGLAGTTVVPAFTVDLGSSYQLVTFDLFLDYDPDALTFLEASSTLQVGAQSPVGWIDALDALAQGSGGDFAYMVEQRPGQYSVNGMLLLGVVPVAGPVTLHAAFQIAGDAAPGDVPQVRFHGLSSQQLPSGDYTDDRFTATSVVGVSAIPEPAHWLMLVSGMALVALRARTRAQRRDRRARSAATRALHQKQEQSSW